MPVLVSSPESVCLPDSEHRAEYRALGYTVLADLWPDALSAALEAEALERWPHAEYPSGGPRTPIVEARAPKRQTPVACGDVLSELHAALTPVARALSSRVVVPSFSAYGYYVGDDRVLLHVDSDQCDVTLLVNALGTVGPLHLRHELIGLDNAALGTFESDLDWDPSAGTQVHYPPHGLLAMAGNVLPHNRPEHAVDGINAVAALCYKSLY